MWQALGQSLPLALGIAISPIPIVAAILLLLSRRPKASGIGFLIGWVLGIVAVVWLFVALSAVVPENSDDVSQPIIATVQLLLGAALLLIGVRQWTRRPRPGSAPAAPRWIAVVASMNLPKAVVLGFALSAFNPVDLVVSIGAGLVIGSAELNPTETTICIAVFTFLGALTVAIPVVAYLVAPRAVTGPLEHLRTWLLENSAVMTSVMLLLVGILLAGKGVGNY